MPQVFSPGEPETRPLDPTAIVYTTAQKVSAEDTILIYSDADPMGTTCTITGITSTAGGVKLTFSETINPGLYEISDNGYVQNQASFTNGRTRGITKDKVNAIITRMQDSQLMETQSSRC